MTEPHDMAAARRIIRRFEEPEVVSVDAYVKLRLNFRVNSRDCIRMPSLDRYLVLETPPEGRDL